MIDYMYLMDESEFSQIIRNGTIVSEKRKS